MWSAILGALRLAAGLVGLGEWLSRRLARRQARAAGRTEAEREALLQQNEALRQTQDKLHDQLEKAVRRRPGDARGRLRDGTF